MTSTEELSELLATLYAAPLKPEMWQTFFDHLSALTNISSGYLITGSEGQGQEILAGGGFSFNPEVLQLYKEHYGQMDPFWSPFLRNPRVQVIRGEDLVSHDQLIRTEFYNDLLAKNEMESMTLLSCSFTPEQMDIMSVWRRSQDGPMDERSMSLLRTLLPHAQTALHIRSKLATSEARSHFAEMTLDAISAPTFLVDGTGRIRHMNMVATTIVQKADGLCLNGSILTAVKPNENERLKSLILGAVLGDNKSKHRGSGGAMMNSRQTSQPLHLAILPVPENLTSTIVSPCALIFINDPSVTTRSRATMMKMLYSLSPVESRLADLLIQGLELREAANHLRVTIETARFHLKRVLAKTRTHRQANLIRLMLSLPGQP
jgi:DNA-binding CsgD family transcriptional regulator